MTKTTLFNVKHIPEYEIMQW